MRLNLLILSLWGCAGNSSYQKLPYLGNHEYQTGLKDGKTVTDTLFYSIPDFSFIDQTGKTRTLADMQGKVYVADFFFTSCPSICPVMKRNLLKIYKEFEKTPDFLIVSHSIDPVHDSVPVLAKYAQKLGIDDARWIFLTGDKKTMHRQAKAYMSSAEKDPRAPGGYLHSGAFVLIDRQGHIRAACDGTDEKAVVQFAKEIGWVLLED